MHVVESDTSGVVRGLADISVANVFINGGYFILSRDVLDLIEPGDELVERPFERLIEREQLLAYPYDGFWAPMDTLKDKQRLDSLWESGRAPWRLDAPGLDGVT
jgi:glucose-1-phosphate cytidylyltransferase